jgi:4-hydroxybenzoate polyprenyltransferase
VLVESLRPQQWVKNGFVFAALIFSRNLTDWQRSSRVALAALVFCLISSAAYLLNDLLDAPEDRRHPVKRLRPVASGRLGAGTAASVATLLALVALTGAWLLDRSFFLVVASYAAVNLLYSWVLKHVVLLDVFVIGAGFVFRVVGGGLVIHVQISSWLIVCTTLLALFLALSKRRHELVLLGADASNHRSILANYSPYFLDQLIAVVTASTVMSYALYTLSHDVQAKFPGKRLELTIPFVLFGIFRYLYLVHQNEEGGSPTRMLFTDSVLLSVVLMWAASVILIIYL